MTPPDLSPLATLALVPPTLIPPAQMQGTIVNGVIFAALAGAALFAICRPSRRS